MKWFCKDCDLEVENRRDLPSNTYVVEYKDEGSVKYDIVQPRKTIEVFDYYWDNYKENLITFYQTEGVVSPKLWRDPKAKK